MQGKARTMYTLSGDNVGRWDIKLSKRIVASVYGPMSLMIAQAAVERLNDPNFKYDPSKIAETLNESEQRHPE